MRVDINTPWGKLDSDATALQCVAHFRKQMDYILDRKASPHPEFTRQERAGYDIVLASKSEANAQAFITFKGECRERGVKPPTNIEVIRQLKASGKWEDLV